MDKVEELASQLTMRQMTLAVAESCTGGELSRAITSMPGCSTFYQGCVVAYSDIVKIEVVGVPHDCIRNHGAVSQRTALAMANGVREAMSADLGMAITGIAGPGGGTEQKPVGLVHMAVTDLDNRLAEEHNFEGTREEIMKKATDAALKLALRFFEEFEV